VIKFEESSRMVDTAIEGGVNYFDTAFVYNHGFSEANIGKALKKHKRDSFYLATKLPLWETDGGVEAAKKRFEGQLESCQVKYFDYYLLHSLNKDIFARSEELKIYDYLKKEQKAGRIGKLGFSFHDSPEMLEKILKSHEWDFCYLQINYMDWTVQKAKEQYELTEKYEVPVLVMEPVRGGTLSALPKPAADILKEYNPAASQASWALRYAASLPNVFTVLSGMSEMQHVSDNLKTFNNYKPLTAGERKVIEKAYKAFEKYSIVPCTGCKYCVDCPSKVNIPDLFAENNKKVYQGGNINKDLLEAAKNCTECGFCEKMCPQKIGIAELVKRIAGV